MLCQQISVIVAAFSMMVAHGLPSPPPDMGLKVIRQHDITWHGDQTPAKRPFNSNRRQRDPGPANNLTCYNDSIYYAALQSDCASLQAVLSGQQSNGIVERTLDSVCYIVAGTQSSPQTQCCIGTSNPIPNLVDQDYLNLVITLRNLCRDTSGLVAGTISPIIIKSEFNNACLSNHPDECLWSVSHWK